VVHDAQGVHERGGMLSHEFWVSVELKQIEAHPDD
jgi:hypothetical protein